jgi:tripartite-type tricarboxylate transporter receptor subunit TctC
MKTFASPPEAASRRAFLFCAGLACAGAVAAEPYPGRPVRLLVPFAAGGTADLAARVVAEALAAALGQPVVVENRAGAGGTLGTAAAAKEAADGHVLTLGSVSTHATSVSLYKDLKYDPRRDFAPLGMVAEVPSVLVVSVVERNTWNLLTLPT